MKFSSPPFIIWYILAAVHNNGQLQTKQLPFETLQF